MFITSPARILLAIANNPELRVREIAEAAGVTLRSAYRLLAELVAAGYLRRTREGRRNRYQLNPRLRFSDPIVGDHSLGDLLSFVGGEERPPRRASSRR